MISHSHNCTGFTLWRSKKHIIVLYRMKPNSTVPWHRHPGTTTTIVALAGAALLCHADGIGHAQYFWCRQRNHRKFVIPALMHHAARTWNGAFWYLSITTCGHGWLGNSEHPENNFLDLNWQVPNNSPYNLPAVDAGSGDAAQPAPKSPLS